MKGFTRCIKAIACLGSLMLLAGCSAEKKTETEFTPRLDTDARIQLDMIGYFGNFEALDQVMNDFNRFYPNITYSYQQVGGSKEIAYLDANPGVDVFMTSSEFLNEEDSALASRCADLSEAEVDLTNVDPQMLAVSCINGKQLAIPMGQNIYGMVVNTSLLKQEGLSVPNNRAEFMNALSVLKEKGYTPIQGPTEKIYAELTANMLFSSFCDGQPLYKALKEGDQEAAKNAVIPAFELVDELLTNGYSDPVTNASYPEDNYDQAILHFLEGDVPFWVCNTEKVSGIKKRESKSEAFQKNPFSYTFIYPPIGEAGAYCYREPWFGFAASKNGNHPDYAIEFLRFLSTAEEINKMAEVKGIPSVAKNSNPAEIYQQVLSEEALKDSFVNQGEVTSDLTDAWYTCMEQYADRAYGSAQEAAGEYLKLCGLQTD